MTAIARVLELAPDIVILDMTMPVMNAFEAAKEIRRLAPSTKIIPSAFTMFLLTMFLSTAFQQTPSFQNSVVATVSLPRLSG